jgi:LPXTG-motif cell wall-anchored protein
MVACGTENVVTSVVVMGVLSLAMLAAWIAARRKR